MGKKGLLFLIVIFQFNLLYSSVITGEDTSYCNAEIVLFVNADPFTDQELELARCQVDGNGRFELKADVLETTLLYTYIGTYKAFLFVEPNKHYVIDLPPRTYKLPEDKLNPFFKYNEVHLGLLNTRNDELNLLIRMFNDSFVPFYNKHTQLVFSDGLDFEQLDKDIEQLDKPFAKSKNNFFNDYRKYKYGILRFIAYQHKSKNVSDMFFKGQPFLANNPAYVDLFNMVYEDYLSYFTRTDHGKQLPDAINNRQYSNVKRILSYDKVLEPEELLDMVILKSFFKEFYDDHYSRSAMLAIIDSMMAQNKNEIITNTAKSIKGKVTQLLTGYEPPTFELYDIDSNLVGLNDFKGKFVYLNFCSCFSYTCLNEFVMLQNLYNKHNKYLEIVTIVIDEDVQVMADFLQRSGYNWTFLHFDNNPGIFKDYDVRVFPTYYLVDNEGKLSMSPAPAPAEEFEGRLFKVLRAKGIL